MSDIKLFRLDGNTVKELHSQSVAVEVSLQRLIEGNLDTFLGVRFLKTEHSTGKVHGGRIDTLGLDENSCPVIIEYKRATNENVINQGLFYLDWLMDHRAEFTIMVQNTLGADAAKSIEWSAPRLICIAGDFTKYDEYAVRQINRNIELFRYRRYDDLLLLELVNGTMAQKTVVTDTQTGANKTGSATDRSVSDYLGSAPTALQDLFESLRAWLVALGDDVQMNVLKSYIAFKRIKNFACVEVHPQTGTLLVFVKVNPDDIQLVQGFTRDVRKIGHWGTGDLEIRIRNNEELETAKTYILQSFEKN